MDLGDMSFSSLFAGFLFGVIGLWLLKEARRRSNLYNVVISILLMIYPYFTAKPVATWGVGILLCGAAYYFWDY
jgi:hypothetical protein